MRILFLGDIFGKPGRAVLHRHLPSLKQKFNPDITIVNGENAAHGCGITADMADEFFDLGIDVITGGNHSWDKPEIIGYIAQQPRLIRPHNLPKGTPGNGCVVVETGDKRVLVINLLGRIFMDSCDNPFACIEQLLPDDAPPMEMGFDAIIIDFHGEATSEKYCMGHYCDGKASLVVGTHSHVPTADHQILANGTAYQTDAGMCGDYDSSIGMEKTATLRRMLGEIPRPRMTPAQGTATLCGLLVDTDPATGLAQRIEPIRMDGRLSHNLPTQ